MSLISASSELSTCSVVSLRSGNTATATELYTVASQYAQSVNPVATGNINFDPGSAAFSLYWINFNLYLAALGHSPATIGLIATVSSLASAVIAFPMSALSDRIGRKRVLLIGVAIAAVSLVGLLSTTWLPLLWVFGAWLDSLE